MADLVFWRDVPLRQRASISEFDYFVAPHKHQRAARAARGSGKACDAGTVLDGTRLWTRCSRPLTGGRDGLCKQHSGLWRRRWDAR